MKIVITSSRFQPQLGGTIVVASRLAKALTGQNHEVTVLTKTSGAEDESFPYRVARCLSWRDNLKHLREADGVILIEMSLKWWLLTRIANKPHLLTHHAYPNVLGKAPTLEHRLQKFLGRFSLSTGCSRMIADAWGSHVGVHPNPYDETVFKSSNRPRDIDFIFAGRLIEEKGVLVFLDALAKLSGKTPEFTFAILGGGRQEAEIRQRITDLKLEQSLVFLGETNSDDVASWFQRSKCLVIPSIWREPFGLIALEGLACGTQLLCSDQPGLREASGELADFFPTSDSEKLSELMLRQLTGAIELPAQEKIESHLAKYTSAASARWMMDQLKLMPSTK